jgi:hypothetical protein
MDQNEMMLEYLMQMGEMQPEQQAIERQRALVAQMRQGGQMPGMRDSGRMIHAAHPLEFLGSLGSNFMAQQGQGKMEGMEDAYGKRRRGALGDLRGRMGSGGQRIPGTPMTPYDPYDGQQTY